MISRNRTFVTVYLAGACEKRPHTVLSLIPSLQGLQPNVLSGSAHRSAQVGAAATGASSPGHSVSLGVGRCGSRLILIPYRHTYY